LIVIVVAMMIAQSLGFFKYGCTVRSRTVQRAGIAQGWLELG
jgi:hypothetical protein